MAPKSFFPTPVYTESYSHEMQGFFWGGKLGENVNIEFDALCDPSPSFKPEPLMWNVHISAWHPSVWHRAKAGLKA